MTTENVDRLKKRERGRDMTENTSTNLQPQEILENKTIGKQHNTEFLKMEF